MSTKVHIDTVIFCIDDATTCTVLIPSSTEAGIDCMEDATAQVVPVEAVSVHAATEASHSVTFAAHTASAITLA